MSGLIFGCGYLGQRVASRWQAAGREVHAVTRKGDRADNWKPRGLRPIVADITDPSSLADLPAVECVLVAVSPDRSAGASPWEVYVQGLQNVLAQLPAETGQLILISSTGVYGDFEGDWVDESSPTEPLRESGRACLAAEEVLRHSPWNARSTILRLAGIYGPGRVPTRERIASGEWQKITSAGYLNLIHVDDAAQIVDQCSQRRPSGRTYLVSDGHPVHRRDYYQFIAEQLGISSIPWEETQVDPATARSGSNKRISNAALERDLAPNWLYPDYRSGLKAILASS